MRLLIVTPYIGARYGGTSRVVTEIASSLAQLGVSVDVITTTADDTGSLNVSTDSWIAQAGYRIRYFSTWHRKDFIVSPALLFWLRTHIKAYDLVHTHTLFSPLITFTHSICRLAKIPYIVTPHGMLEPWALSYKAWKKRAYYRAFEQSALKGAIAIQALTNSEANHVCSLGNYPTVTIPNGIHQADFSLFHSPENFYQKFPETRSKTLILFLGRIDPKKGLDLLAPAFAKAQFCFPNVHLIVAGPDSINFMPTAQSYFAQAGCLHAVTFTGMLTGSLKAAALSAANLYVAPSYSEGFSLSVLEGMAAGLPCIITHGCNFPEAATAEAAHVVETNSRAIENALLQCLQNTTAAKALGGKAKNFVLQNYTWLQSAKKLNQIYERVVSKTKLPT
jgi:glycosyltransferase involved in cell wall biosynthesis